MRDAISLCRDPSVVGSMKMGKKRTNAECVTQTSADLLGENIERLKALFPEAVTEGKVDFARLRDVLGDEVDDRPERYWFTWAGKGDAIRLLQTPSRATLVPAPKESVNFDQTNNIFIEGENLEVLKLLYKSYAGQVKMIYIDPPYNTGNDFVYQDDFTDPLGRYLELTAQRDTDGNLLTSNPETSGRYHSDWLKAIYPRLFLARQLLHDEGVIFVSIDDHEVHNLRLAMNQVFGEENFAAQITVINNPKGRGLKEHFAVSHDYLLVYTKRSEDIGITKTDEEVEEQYPHRDGKRRYRLLELRNTHRQFNRKTRPNLYFPIYINPKNGEVSLEKAKGRIPALPNWDNGLEGCWTWGRDKADRESNHLVGREINGTWKVFRQAYAEDDAGNTVKKKLQTVWTERAFHTEVGQAQFDELIPGRVFEAPKPVGLVEQMVRSCTTAQEEAIILDFYAGSGTTGHSVLELNLEDGGRRRFVLVQLPELTPDGSNARSAGFETISEIAKERLRRAIRKLAKDSKGKLQFTEGPHDLGFKVFKLTGSNYRQWKGAAEKDGEALLAEMEKTVDPLLPGWGAISVIYEVALKEGYTLTCTIEKTKETKGNALYLVNDPDRDQSFRICVDDKLKDATIKAMKLGKDDVFICRDVALTDEQAANLALQCNLKTI